VISPAEALEAWKSAELAVRAAETMLKAAWMEVDSGRLRSVPESLIASVESLRCIASEKLTVALQALGKRAQLD
jgi:hypothetical protein